MSLITVQDLSGYIGTTLTTGGRASAIVDAVNAQVENYIGSKFGTAEGGVEVTETLDYDPVLWLKYINVIEILELKIDKRIMTSGTYRLNKSLGRVIIGSGDSSSISARVGQDAVEIKYKVGVKDVPLDLKLACLQIASAMFNRKDEVSSAGVSSASVGGLNISFGNSTNNDAQTGVDGSHDVTSYMATLNSYRRRKL